VSSLYTRVKTPNGIVKVRHDDVDGQKMATLIYDLEMEIESNREISQYDKKINEKIIEELTEDKELWFKKYHDCRNERFQEQLLLQNKITKLEAELFNLQQYYEIVYDNYCNLADFLAEKLGKKNTDEAMDEFKEWLVKK